MVKRANKETKKTKKALSTIQEIEDKILDGELIMAVELDAKILKELTEISKDSKNILTDIDSTTTEVIVDTSSPIPFAKASYKPLDNDGHTIHCDLLGLSEKYLCEGVPVRGFYADDTSVNFFKNKKRYFYLCDSHRDAAHYTNLPNGNYGLEVKESYY
jgi:hypothetical protein